MIEDCESGKIDLLLTKSISRFARNTLECLTYVRKLNSLGVHIIFEINRIDTRATYSEMLLTVLAAFAQEESRSISENTSWGIRKRFEEGVTRWCKLYGYEKNENGEYQIVPEQAVVVKMIFDFYEHGKSIQGIRRLLAARGIKSPKGEAEWSNSAINMLLNNERYAGDILLQKYFTEDHLSHRSVKNDRTEIPSYYIEKHHAPIISKKQFDRCQKIMGMRLCNSYEREHESGTCNQYPLGDKLRCPYCGSVLYQRGIPIKAKHRSGWCCEKGDDACHGFIIHSNLVGAALLEAYGRLDATRVSQKTGSPRFGKAAELMLRIKKEYPSMVSVEYWWVDDLVDHIEFGAHSRPDKKYRRMVALGEQVEDDRTMKVFWKCGLVTTVMSGVDADSEHPPLIAKQYNDYLERKKAREAQREEDIE